MKPIFLLITFAAFLWSAKASVTVFYNETDDDSATHTVYTFTNPLDQIFERDRITGVLQLPDTFDRDAMRGLTFNDTLFFNPLFLPVIFQGRILPRDLSFFPIKDKNSRGVLIPESMTLAPQLATLDFVQNVRRQFYINNPHLITFTADELSELPVISSDEHVRIFNPLLELVRTESTVELVALTVTGAEIRRRYWQRSGEHSLQFAQNYFSENWHRGGVSNLNINNQHTLRANFRRNNVRFYNTLEWRLTLNSTSTDTLRNFIISNDIVRYSGNFGLEAFRENWAYSTNVTATTPLFNTFPPNSNDIRAAFLSPLIVNAGVGLTYTLNRRIERVRHRRVRLNLELAPLAINYTYVNHPDVSVRRFGIDEGHRSNLEIGSTVNCSMIFDFNRFVTWTSRFHYFTSYSRIITEFDNTLNMALTNAFSTRIQLNMRFDDGVSNRDDRFGLLQVNQMISFGLNYRW